MSITDNKIISLNSADATLNNGTMKSNVYFNFSGLLKEEEGIKQVYISVINAQLPVSYYIINNTNNSLILFYNSIYYHFIIPDGNYNATTLINTLTGLFISTPITITINKLTGILSFSSIADFSFLYEYNSIMPILGFDKANATATLISGTYKMSAPYPLNLLGIKLIEIKSSAFALTSFDSRTLNASSVLVSMPSDKPPFNLISYVSNNPLDNHILNQRILNGFDILITDENNNFLDFHNIDWSMTICLSVIRDEDNQINRELRAVLDNNILREQLEDIKPKEKTIDEKELEILES
jgi:hypothetical protein